MVACPSNCGICCWVVPIPEAVLRVYLDKLQVNVIQTVRDQHGNLMPLTADGYCAYLDRQTKRCAIYADRPQLCRDFGTPRGKECPLFDVNNKSWPDAHDRYLALLKEHKESIPIPKVKT